MVTSWSIMAARAQMKQIELQEVKFEDKISVVDCPILVT